MRILVTGGAGFIGSHLVGQLVAADHDVFVLDDFSTGRMRNLSGVMRRKNLVLLKGDVRCIRRSLLKKLKGLDRVCHLAALTSVQESIENPIRTNETNVVGTIRVLELAERLRAERVVFASSAAVYGIPETMPLSEDSRLAPVSPYGASKAASELYLRSFEESSGIEAISLRYFNVYGPRQSSSQYSGVISIFSRRINRDLPLTIFGDGSQSRDFVYVKDAVDGTVAALEKKNIQSRNFNIASGTETTILQLARTMQRIVGAHAQSEPQFKPPRKGEVPRSLADITRAQSQLGYRPTASLRDGLSETMKWYVRGSCRTLRNRGL